MEAPGRRPGRPADRRRPAGVHLLRRRRARAPGEPRASTCPRSCRTARRAACRSPASTTTPRGPCGSWPRASTSTASRSTIEGSELLARRHPARDRPPRRHPVHRPDGPRAAQARAEGDPRGGVDRCSQPPTVKDQPARAPSARRCSRSREARLRRHPAGRRPVAGGDRRLARTSCVAVRHPARRARRARAARRRAPPSRSGPTSTASRCCSRAGPSRAGVPRRAAPGSRPDCCPVVAYGALVPEGRARRPAARLGQPALLAAARLARRRPGAARADGRRRGHRRDHVPARAGPGHRAGVRRAHRDDPPDGHRRRPARTGCRRPAPACWSPPSTASTDGTSSPVPQAADGVSSRRRSPWRRPGSTGRCRRYVVDRRIRGCTPAPGAWTTLRGERVKIGPLRDGPHAAAVGDASGRASTGCATGPEVVLRTERRRVRARRRPAAGQADDAAADWARGAAARAGGAFG